MKFVQAVIVRGMPNQDSVVHRMVFSDQRYQIHGNLAGGHIHASDHPPKHRAIIDSPFVAPSAVHDMTLRQIMNRLAATVCQILGSQTCLGTVWMAAKRKASAIESTCAQSCVTAADAPHEKKMKTEIHAGIVCPLTKRQMVSPTWFGDGGTYEREAIANWMQSHPYSSDVRGPTGRRIFAPVYGINQAVNNKMPSSQPTGCEIMSDADCKTQPAPSAVAPRPLCPITRETMVVPVAIIPKVPNGTKVSNGTNAVWTDLGVMATYEASALVEALKATWSAYNMPLARSYLPVGARDMDHTSKALGDTHVLLLNRALLVGNGQPPKLPQLPTRGDGPKHNPTAVRPEVITRVATWEDNLESRRCFSATEESNSGVQFFCNLNISSSVFGFHGKLYRFINCLFTDCVFNGVCWCAVSFTACRFERCTWIDCTPRHAAHAKQHMLNNEYEDCAIISHLYHTPAHGAPQSELESSASNASNASNALYASAWRNDSDSQDLKDVLIGVQTFPGASRRCTIRICPQH